MGDHFGFTGQSGEILAQPPWKSRAAGAGGNSRRIGYNIPIGQTVVARGDESGIGILLPGPSARNYHWFDSPGVR